MESTLRSWLVQEGLERDGLARVEQPRLLRSLLLWARDRADPELTELQRQHDAELRKLMAQKKGPSARQRERWRNLEEAQAKRLRELSSDFRMPVGIRTAETLPGSARRLLDAPDLATLLERYRQLDSRLELLEHGVTFMELEWDRLVDHLSDLARGK